MARRKVIIDTDPGVDDVLALLLALASPELEVLAITTVHGNINVLNTTRNTLSLFNVLHAASTSWARRYFQSEDKIVIAAGAETPLLPEKQLDAAYFHGTDGLGGVSAVFPEYLPPTGWQTAFPSLCKMKEESSRASNVEFHGLFPSPQAAHEEMLHILSSEEADTVSIVALGPLTNLSLACSQDYETFSRAQEVIVMGGALTVPGNVTPKAEFNFLADPEAAAHVFSFTSPTPSSTYPASPRSVAKRLSITLLPLDTTTTICLSHKAWDSGHATGLLRSWCSVFINKTFETMSGLYRDSSVEKVNLSMHDPACIWYLLSHSNGPPQSTQADELNSNGWTIRKDVDVRIECAGRWTRGESVIDERGRQRVAEVLDDVDDAKDESDNGTWLDPRRGNRVAWVTRSPGSDAFANLFMSRVFDD